MTRPDGFPYPFDAPATYRIVVDGVLNRDWSDRLEGMTIEHIVADRGPTKTVLKGELIDQAALAGVLLRLYELHVTLVEVEQIPSVAPPQQSESDEPQA